MHQCHKITHNATTAAAAAVTAAPSLGFITRPTPYYQLQAAQHITPVLLLLHISSDHFMYSASRELLDGKAGPVIISIWHETNAHHTLGGGAGKWQTQFKLHFAVSWKLGNNWRVGTVVWKILGSHEMIMGCVDDWQVFNL